jgi:CheY-like chemotaxis protein
MDVIVGELIKILPALLWFALAASILFIYRQRMGDLLSRLSSIEFMGTKLACMADAIDDALELAEKSPQWQVHISPGDKRRALNRARRHHEVFRGAQFLWVDDHPENNVNERRMFRQLHVDIDTVTSNDVALMALEAAKYDLLLTDIGRDNETSNGLDLLRMVHSRGMEIPIVIYVGSFRPEMGVPGYAFGVAHRPDQLLHLTLDVLDRKRDL